MLCTQEKNASCRQVLLAACDPENEDEHVASDVLDHLDWGGLVCCHCQHLAPHAESALYVLSAHSPMHVLPPAWEILSFCTL